MIGRRQFTFAMVFLTVINTIGVYGALVFLLFYPVPNENRELVSMIIGNVLGFVAAIVAFHFGSSQDSMDKTHAIGNLAETAKTATQAAAGVPSGESAHVAPGESITITGEETRP